MELDIDVILEDLKDGKVPRTKQNLDTLNNILKVYAESGQKDFSITQIGRISAAESGPGYEALR
ncbi:gamma-mobile-trio protein GmtX, partial [Pseudoalteromonas nigrifaciens]